MKLDQVFKSASLKAEDLKGRRRTLTISEVEIKDFGDGQPKPIFHFEETEKTFVANKTNSMTLASLTGSDDTDDWTGWCITLRPDMTQYQGKPMPCIRVDSELPEQKNGKKTGGDDDDDIPF